MFSAQLQNYINSASFSNAYSRVNEINNRINSINQPQTIQVQPQTSFEKILAQSKSEVESESIFKTEDNLPKLQEKKPVIKTNNPFGSLTTSNKDKAGMKAKIIGYIKNACDKYGVEEKLVHALVRQESGFNPNAVSKAGAKGLMQLMPGTARSLGVIDSFDPEQNIEGGVKYLKQMLDRYNGNKILALAAYNAGPGAVDKYSGVPPYKETQNYVKAILKNYL